MPPTQEERLREEFEKWAYTHTTVGSKEDKDISDFWLSKIADLHKEWVEEARRDIVYLSHTDEYKRISDEYFAYGNALNKVLALPYFNPLPTSSKSHRDTVEGGGDGNVRCCDNGDFGEKHKCLKSNSK